MKEPVRRPLIWIACSFVVGQLIVHYSVNNSYLIWLAAAYLLVISLFVYLNRCTRLFAIILLGIACLSIVYSLIIQSKQYSPLLRMMEEYHIEFDSVDSYDGLPVKLSGVVSTAAVVDGDRIILQLLAKEATVFIEGEQKPLEEKVVALKEKFIIHIALKEQQEQQLHQQMMRGTSIELNGTIHLPNQSDNRNSFDYAQYLQQQHIYWLYKVASIEEVTWLAESRSFHAVMLYRLDQLRYYLARQLEQLFDERNSGFMKGLLLGIRHDVDEEQLQHFTKIGITHILAISGLHVAVLMHMIARLLQLCRVTREKINIVLYALLPFYILLSGASPSVIRAGVMAIIALVVMQSGRKKDTIHIISATGLMMLWYKPAYIYDISFQLSFIVTCGLVVGVPVLRNYLPQGKIIGYFCDICTVSVVAQLISFPLTVYYFNQTHLLSLVANIIFIPIISSIVLPLGMISLLLSLLSMPLASSVAAIIAYLNDYLQNWIDWFAQDSAYVLIWATPPLWWVIAWLAVCFLLFVQLQSSHFSRKNKMIKNPTKSRDWYGMWKWRGVRIVLLGSGLLILLTYSYQYSPSAGMTEISFISVGQGDAALIRTASGKVILVDGGGTVQFGRPKEQWQLRKRPFEVGEQLLVPLLKKRGIKQIDMLVISHLDTDHIGGLRALVEHIPVREVWWNQTLRNSSDALELMEMIVARDIPMYAAIAGDSYQLHQDINIQFLWPNDEAVRRDMIEYVEDQNEWSVVLLVEIEGYSVLITGDIGIQTEKFILAQLQQNGSVLQGRQPILKVAHHGSKHSTSEEWLAYFQPQVAVISAGARNSYGHPHPDVLTRLHHHSVLSYQTAVHGETVFRIKKGVIYIYTKRSSIYERMLF